MCMQSLFIYECSSFSVCIEISSYLVFFFDVECGVMVSTKHLGEIADEMDEWEGCIADHLGLTNSEVAAIKVKHEKELKLQM